MKVTIRLFAVARERAGASEIILEIGDGADVGDLKRAIAEQWPALAPIVPSLMIAIDAEYADDSDRVPEFAEIAAIPPVSGGAKGS